MHNCLDASLVGIIFITEAYLSTFVSEVFLIGEIWAWPTTYCFYKEDKNGLLVMQLANLFLESMTKDCNCTSLPTFCSL